jgi:hypothetical protein
MPSVWRQSCVASWPLKSTWSVAITASSKCLWTRRSSLTRVRVQRSASCPRREPWLAGFVRRLLRNRRALSSLTLFPWRKSAARGCTSMARSAHGRRCRRTCDISSAESHRRIPLPPTLTSGSTFRYDCGIALTAHPDAHRRAQAAMRISISNWSTTEQDIDRSADAIIRSLAATT